MTYPSMNEILLEHLRPTFEEIMSLSSGEFKILESSTRHSRDQLRDRLYSWMHSSSIKHLFRIKRLGEKKLLIERKNFEVPKVVHTSTASSLTPSQEHFFLSSLIGIEEEALVLGLLDEGVEEERITKEDSSLLLKEWKRVMGRS